MAAGLVLEVYEGVGQVRRVPLEPGQRLSIGRTQGCDIVVTAGSVSRTHCRLEHTGGDVRLTNLSSTRAGTLVNGRKVEEATLQPGDELGVGDVVIVVAAGVAGAAGSSAPAAAAEAGRPAAPEAPGAAADSSAAREAEAEERSGGREAALAFVARKRAERRFRLAGGAVAAVVVAGGLGWVAVDAAMRAPGDPARPTPPPRPPVLDDVAVPGPAELAWRRLRDAPPGGLAAALEAFAAEHPDDPRADDARFFLERLAAAAPGPSGGRRLGAILGVLTQEAERRQASEDLSGAHAILQLVSLAAPDTPEGRAARAAQAALRAAAADAVAELRGRARALVAQLGPVPALVRVLEVEPRLRGLDQDEALGALTSELEEEAARELARARAAARQVERSERAGTVEREAFTAALRFDFAEARARLDELLLLALDDEARYRAHWLRGQVGDLQGLVAATLAAAEGPRESRPTCTLRGSLEVRLKGVAGGQVLLEPVVSKGAGELRWEWTRLTPSQIQELFSQVGTRDWRLTRAKAFHAFATGLEDRGVELLTPFAHHASKRGEVFSFFALAARVPMPEGGFVLHQGRLVDPAERDRLLAAREEARAAARELAAAAREEQARSHLLRILERAAALMDEGHYAAGRAALGRLAEEHAAVEGVGDAARRRLESPVLRRRDMRLARGGRNGPSANRLDVYMLGDGFVLDDQKQVQFDRYADQAMKFCQLQDFFKEYDAYLNYWAVNLASAEEGLTRGDQDKDTALGGRIDDGRYTIPGSALALLERHFPGEHDRLLVGIGNDFASVATGGGGVVACAKTMLAAVPHELGHAFGGLGDEYDAEPGATGAPPPAASGHVPARPLGPNLIGGNRREELLEAAPWKAWLDPTGESNWSGEPVDLFEGGDRQPKDVWRPQRACVMRDVGAPFCVVCMEVMVRRLYERVRPIDQTWPEEEALTADREPITFRVLVMKPATHDLMVHWRRRRLGAAPASTPGDASGTTQRPDGDGAEAAAPVDVSGRLTTDGVHYIHFIKLRPRELDPGRYEVSAEVWDPTPWVREEHRAQLTETRRWVVTIPPR